jgi:lipopolysaccharide heptosyltransferase II
MNILQVVPQLDVGGVETGTIDLAKYLVKGGHRCVVASGGGDLVVELEAAGIKHYKLPLENKAFWVMLKAARKLAVVIREENIDIVHARSRVPAWVGFMATRQAKAAFITTAHGHYSRHIFSYMMGWGKYTIVPSSVIGKHMVEDFGVPLENIRVIPRSVDLGRYTFRGPKERNAKEFLVGVIGRITPIKGQLYFLKALAGVLRASPSVKAWIVGGISPGKDNYMEELEVWARRLGLSETVSFLGNRRDIPEILSKLDCLVMPSIAEESFGRVIVEAQAIGVPVVATKVGGIVEIIEDGKDGLLVYPRDHEGLAEAILKILKDPKVAKELVANARKKVEEKFSLEKMGEDTVRVYRETLEKPRLLVIKISAIGDAILAVPSFRALRKKFPSAHITCLVGQQAKDVFQRCPYMDELIVCDFKQKDRGGRGLWRLSKKLVRRRFDLVIDLQNNKKSHFLSYMSFAPERYGYHNGKLSFLLNHKIKDPGDSIGPVEHQFRVLKMLDILDDDKRLEIWPSEEDKAFADNFLAGHNADPQWLIGINIGVSPRWESKRWLGRRFVQLCDELSQEGFQVLLTGGPSDAPFAKSILAGMKSKPLCAVAQTTLMQLASLIGKCRAFVTSDSAPLHVAIAMGTPVVALFGPTDARRHMPPASAAIVLQKGCLPCYEEACKKRNHLCMTKIGVDDVMRAIEQLLQEARVK